MVIEATGSPLAVVDAFDYARDAGRVVILGQYTDLGEVSFSPHVINRKHLTVLGCWGSDFSHFYRAVEIMARPGNAEKWQRLGTRNYGLPDVNQALTDVAAGSVAKALIRS